MSSILKVSEIQDPTNGNTALTIDSSGTVKSNSIFVSAGVTSLQGLQLTPIHWLAMTTKYIQTV